MMSYEVQAALRLLHAEADRLLANEPLERKVMQGQLNWMRMQLLQHDVPTPEEMALHQTMQEAKARQAQRSERHRLKRKLGTKLARQVA